MSATVNILLKLIIIFIIIIINKYMKYENSIKRCCAFFPIKFKGKGFTK